MVSITGPARSGSKPRRYLFIDGAYFQRSVESQSKRIGLSEPMPIDFNLVGHGFDRVIYFDALPVQKPKQNDREYEKEFDEKTEFLNSLRKVRNFHVRDGFTRVRPRKNGGIEQKGVDTWIAIEALQYAFRGVIDTAEVITGDLDLYPLFEALVQTNTRGVLHYEFGHTSDDLIMAADEAKPMTGLSLLDWAERKFAFRFKVFAVSERKASFGQPITEFESNYGRCYLRYDGEDYLAEFESLGNQHKSKNVMILLDYLRQEFGVVGVEDNAIRELQKNFSEK